MKLQKNKSPSCIKVNFYIKDGKVYQKGKRLIVSDSNTEKFVYEYERNRKQINKLARHYNVVQHNKNSMVLKLS